MDQSFYDEDYYIRGLETNKSTFQNYRWLPEYTIPAVMTMIDYLGIKCTQTVLDYGCASGNYVRAFRMLNRKAWGVDISKYAISQVDNSIADYCFLLNGEIHSVVESLGCLPTQYDFVILKDILEHISPDNICKILDSINSKTFFVIVPLGENGKYIAPSNGMDKSHIICEDEKWWSNLFLKNNLIIKEFNYMIKGIKDSYYTKYPKAHGFWVLAK